MKIWMMLLAVVLLWSCIGSSSPNTDKNTVAVDSVKLLEAEPVPDLKQLPNVTLFAGKSMKVVESMIGKADSQEKIKVNGKMVPKTYHQNGKYEVVYLNGKADWITINKLGDYPLKASSLDFVTGITSEKASPRGGGNVLYWEIYEGYSSIQLFSNGRGGIDYAFIKAITK